MANFRRTGKSKYAQAEASPADISKKIGDLDITRDQLTEELLKYREYLKDKTLNSNKTELEKKAVNETFTSIQNLAIQLESQNVGEGNMTLSIAALRSVLIVHNEVNSLTWRVYSLYEKLDAMNEKLDKLLTKEEIPENE